MNETEQAPIVANDSNTFTGNAAGAPGASGADSAPAPTDAAGLRGGGSGRLPSSGSPINRPRVRAQIRVLERKLSETSTSAERAPLLDQLEAKQTQLHAYYRRLRELPRYDHNGAPLPRFTVHAPLEPPRETPDPEETT